MAAEFDLVTGLTAFVGPNKSGRSTILRLFWELRPARGPYEPASPRLKDRRRDIAARMTLADLQGTDILDFLHDVYSARRR